MEILFCQHMEITSADQRIPKIDYIIYINIYTQVFFNYSIIFHSQIREKKLVKKWLHTNVSFLCCCA